MADFTKCLFCAEIIYPYKLHYPGGPEETDRNVNVPTFSTLCDSLQLNWEEGASSGRRRILFEKLNSYYGSGNGREKVSRDTGCNSFLCLSCFERVDLLAKLHEQVKETQRKIREGTRGLEELLAGGREEQDRGERGTWESDTEFWEILKEFQSFLREHRASLGAPETENVIDHFIVVPDDDDYDCNDPTGVVEDTFVGDRDDDVAEIPVELEREDVKIGQDRDPLSTEEPEVIWLEEETRTSLNDQEYHASSTDSDSSDEEWNEHYSKRKKQKRPSKISKSPGTTRVYNSTPTTILITHRSGNKVTCPQCPPNSRPFKNKHCLRNHIRIKHTRDEDKNIRCGECGKGFFSNILLQTHLIKVHKHEDTRPKWMTDRVKCNLCEMTFVSKYTMALHVQTQHEKADRIQCEDCGHTSKNFLTLRYHRRLCREKIANRVTCDLCDNGKFFKNATFLANHKKAVHS